MSGRSSASLPPHESVRLGWPATLEAALRLGRLDEARELIVLLADRPGHVPPYLPAPLARGRALLAIAEDRHDEVEAGLTEAIERCASLPTRTGFR